MKCQLSFTILDLGKPKILSSLAKQLRCVHGGARADDIDLFQRNRRRQFATLLDHEISYTRYK